jgi:hypothetical protein
VEALKRFRVMAVQLSLLALLVLAGVTFFWSRPAAHGLLLGGIAGVVVFWFQAVRMEKLAKAAKPQGVLHGVVYVVVYMAVLYKAYHLDSIGLHGILSAVAGLFVIRGAALVLGLTGWDLKKPSP